MGISKMKPTSQTEEAQRAVCLKFGAKFVPASGDAKTGIALSTKGKTPINGLRHPPTTETSGWYIWFGEEFSAAPDFFDPVHTHHLNEQFPEILKYLGLPPGYRFLLAGEHVDVWYDTALLNT
jgi:hypothetical protein